MNKRYIVLAVMSIIFFAHSQIAEAQSTAYRIEDLKEEALIQILSDKFEPLFHRQLAAYRLAEMNSEKSLHNLRAILTSDPRLSMRLVAVRALTLMKSSHAIDILGEVLAVETNPDFCMELLMALSKKSDPAILPFIGQALIDKQNIPIGLYILQLFKRIHEAHKLPSIIDKLGLNSHVCKEVVAWLKKTIQQAQNPDVQQAAFDTLLEIVGENDIPDHILDILSNFNSGSSVLIISKYIKTEKGSRLLSFFKEILHSWKTPLPLWKECIKVLGSTGRREFFPLLKEAYDFSVAHVELSNSQINFHIEIIKLLENFPYPETISFLKNILLTYIGEEFDWDWDWKIKEVAMPILRKLNSEDMRPLFENILLSVDYPYTMRRCAAEQLGIIKNPASIPILKKSLQSNVESLGEALVQETVLSALVEYQDPELITFFEQEIYTIYQRFTWYQDYAHSCVVIAIEALGRIETTEAIVVIKKVLLDHVHVDLILKAAAHTLRYNIANPEAKKAVQEILKVTSDDNIRMYLLHDPSYDSGEH